MYGLKGLTERAFVLYKANDILKNTYIYVQRCCACYTVFGDREYLEKAYEAVEAKKGDMTALLYEIFLNIELGNFSKAEDEINAVMYYKKYLRSSEKEMYLTLLFLEACLNAKRNHKKAAVKAMNSFDELCGRSNKYAEFYKAVICMYIKANSAEDYLLAAYELGLRSELFFAVMYRYFNRKNALVFNYALLTPLFNWGVLHNVELNDIIEQNRDYINLKFFDNYRIGMKLYRQCSSEHILRNLCRALMTDLDYSMEAYYFYSEAVKRQLEINGLNKFLIESAYKNDIEKLGIHPIREYLSLNTADDELKAFIYYIILSDKKYRLLVKEYESDVVKYGIDAVKQGKAGRYFYSIYKFLYDKQEEYSDIEKYRQKLEMYLAEKLFYYEVTVDNSSAKYIWIREKEKNNMERSKIENGRAMVRLVGDRFEYYLFDAAEKEILTGKAVFKRLIENADVKFYQKFYSSNIKNEYMILYLTKYYVGLENPPKDYVELFKSALALKTVSVYFKMKITAALGNIYYADKDYKTAVEYYKRLNINSISYKYSENIIETAINAKEYSFAVEMLLKQEHAISDKALFYAVKNLIRFEEYQKKVVNYAYELLMKSCYDRGFIRIVIKYYNGSQEEWKQLGAVLESMSVPEKEIDEMIIGNSIYMHSIDDDVIRIFESVYERALQSSVIMPFIEYCCYEIITNGFAVKRNMVDILEKAYEETTDYYILTALVYTYEKQNIMTETSGKLKMEFADYIEKNGIGFSWLEQGKDKIFRIPYIEKNKTFTYCTAPHKNVLMYYKTDIMDTFKYVKMKYFRYGLYIAVLPVFYDERVEYYFSEKMENGSIETSHKFFVRNEMYVRDESRDMFFLINNALIYEKMFKYDKVEKMISNEFEDEAVIMARLL